MEAIIVDIFLLYFCWRGPYLPWLKVPDLLLSWSKIPDLPFFHQRRELIDAPLSRRSNCKVALPS
jgi:hypothetical protein